MADVLDMIAERGEVELAELAEHFSTSSATMRRDLAAMADHGLILRTHGGAKVASSLTERPVALKDTRFREAKRRIARAAAARVPRERYAVALSGGTTAAGVARELAGHSSLTIVTNSLPIANLVSRYPKLKIIMTGGILRAQSLELVGVLAEDTFNSLNIGMAILGADGFSAASGLTTYDETEARANRAMVMHAKTTVVVADSSKIGNVALARIATAPEVDVLITDGDADPAELQRLRDAGVIVVIA
ncbi:DeoR/GlpR family DNA-binding transcription regulator [Microbacterium gorillae]|uniref:DeoR/GlpR family DNA-binding transcription regulator n=1 Tax=Microbacterium gorillae TaxID=1231063 RepID=UPI001E30D981|nr:DeoR/GlpR family DNA-binding transcription regulator [Microbacterium gorillae]